MTIKRIVSFLPSATELLYELELEELIYGVTHECRYPPNASTKPQIIKPVIESSKLTSKEINDMTCQLLEDGKDIFVLDETELKKANPDLIITQDTCSVCAAHTNQVNRAIEILEGKPTIHSMDPHNLQEIISLVSELGKLLKKESKAKEITKNLEKRIQDIKQKQNNPTPKVLAIEWIEPFFTAGHWIPEMVGMAGGINQISKKGEHSRRMDIQEIINSNPDIIIMMPCGFDVKRTILEYEQALKQDKTWNTLSAVKNNQVFAVDANSFFSKPSIRTIEGLDILAKIIQPDRFTGMKISNNKVKQIIHK